jgi:hypothetical protein
VGNVVTAAETKLNNALYNGENERFTWETCVRIHMEHHVVLNGMKEYGYSGIDESSKVRILMKGIKRTELDVCKANITTNPAMRDNSAAKVELHSTFIKQTNTDNPQMAVL